MRAIVAGHGGRAWLAATATGAEFHAQLSLDCAAGATPPHAG